MVKLKIFSTDAESEAKAVCQEDTIGLLVNYNNQISLSNLG